MRRRVGLVMLFVFGIASAALSLRAQQITSISGSVTDPSGAVIPGAQVTLLNTATGVKRNVVTNSSGYYAIPSVDVGVYDVTVSARGFKSAAQQDLRVNVGAKLSVNFQMQVGSATQTVAVKAAATHLQLDTAAVSNVITGPQIQAIAINGRNWDQLAQLTPGVNTTVNSGYSGVGHLSVGGIGFNGMRGASNQWSVDGSNDLDPGSRGSLDVSPALNAISQFRVQTSNYSAAYGQAGGAVISAELKSGTNDFHGSAYEFIRNDALDSRPSLPYVAHVPVLKLNDFGFTLGGPVVRRKLFFFYSSEWRRLRQASIFQAHTPVGAEWSGASSAAVFSSALKDPVGVPPSCFPTPTTISPSCFDSNAVALMNSGVFPAPQGVPTGKNGFNNFVEPVSNPTNYDQELFRVDYDINSKMRLMVHYIRERYSLIPTTTQWGGSDFPTISDTFDVPSKNVAVRLTDTISPTLLNEVDVDYTNDSDIGAPVGKYAIPSGYTTKTIFGNNADSRVPQLSFSQGYHGIDPNYWPYSLTSPVYTFTDTLTQTHGSQTFSYGAMYQRGEKNQPNQCRTEGSFSFNGQFTGNAVADFLLGYPNNYSECSANVRGLWRYNQLEAFGEDDWKATRRLSLNLGVRYYYIPHAYAANSGTINGVTNRVTYWQPSLWDPAQAPTLDSKGNVSCTPTYSLYPKKSPCNMYDGLLYAGTSNPAGIGKSMSKVYHYNFGPRLGISWLLPGIPNTDFRAGYGMSYYRVQGNDTYNVLGNPPLVANASYDNSTTAPAKLLDNPAAGTTPPVSPLGIFVQEINYRIPMYQSYSAGFQHMFGSGQLLSIMYVGSHGEHLRRGIDFNEPRAVSIGGVGYDFNPALNTGSLPTNLARTYPGFGGITMQVTDGNSDYNSLQVNFQKQMTNNLRFQAAYTFGRDFTNAAVANNACNFRRQSCWEQDNSHTHMLVVNYIYNLPFFKTQKGFAGETLGGWRWSGITVLESGNPLTATVTGSHDGLNEYPDLAAHVAYPKTKAEWFNTSPYSYPAYGYYGNEHLNTLFGPHYMDWDMTFAKTFSIFERVHAQVEADLFNIFNIVNLNNPTTTFGNANFGKITASGTPRQIQVGINLTF